MKKFHIIYILWKDRMIMRKKICSVMMIMTFAAMLTGCGGEEKDKTTVTESKPAVTEQGSLATDNDVKELEVGFVADEILNGGDFKDNLATVDKSIALTRLYNLDETQIAEAAFYTNSNATAEEIAVIRTVNSDYAETVKTAYEARIAEQKEACRDYLPGEMTKLESAVIYTNGNYVVLCISNDNAKAQTIIEDLFE